MNCLDGQLNLFEATQPRTGPAIKYQWSEGMLERAKNDPHLSEMIQNDNAKAAATAVEPDVTEIQISSDLVSQLQELFSLQEALRKKEEHLASKVKTLLL